MIDEQLLGFIGELKLAVERLDYDLREIVEELRLGSGTHKL